MSFLSDLYNAPINLWGEISCHRHFKEELPQDGIFLSETERRIAYITALPAVSKTEDEQILDLLHMNLTLLSYM
jgi:hypothetical protein